MLHRIIMRSYKSDRSRRVGTIACLAILRRTGRDWVISEAMHSIRTIGRDRVLIPRMDIGYTSLILFRGARAHARVGLIRKLHSFPADVLPSDYCSRYNAPLPPCHPQLRARARALTFYFLLDSQALSSSGSTSSFPGNPSFSSQVP